MAVEIFNEGRITGYSAYEIYVKQHLAQDPNTPVASEREWLAASLGMGSSMLLKFPTVSGIGESEHCYVDIVLPSNCILAAANTIVASFFDGDAAFSAASCYQMGSEAVLGGGGWATKITDYGQLIDNSSATSSEIPAKTLQDWDENKKAKLRDYMKIVDGLVLQPGTWSVNTTPPPAQDFSADLTGESIPKIRIHIRGPIEHNPLILLTGFTIKSVLIGTVGTDTAVNTASPQNGDFLGPAVFPWANKIIFSVPTSYIVYFASGAYERNLPADGTGVKKLVSDTPVIDMRSGSEQVYRTEQGEQKLAAPVLENYYATSFTQDELFYPGVSDEISSSSSKTSARVYDDVKSFSTLGDGTAVLTVYSRVAYFPPVLYGTFVSSTGENYLHPIDTAAPGTVKMFYNDVDGSNMSKYETDYPGTVAMNRTPEGGLEIFDHNGNKVSIPPMNMERVEFQTSDSPWALDRRSGCIENEYDSNNKPVLLSDDNPYRLRISTGSNSRLVVSLSNSTSNSTQTPIFCPANQSQQSTDQYYNSHVITAEHAENGSNNITWGLLLEALSRNLGIDILQDRLKSIQRSLIRHRTDTEGPYIEFGAEDKSTTENPEAPIRLYITNVAPRPENVPVGSIGIGWGFTENQN